MKKPNLIKILWNSARCGWTDHDWGCRATWWWYIRHKCFGRNLWLKLESSFLRINHIHKVGGTINTDSPTSYWCTHCDKRWESDDSKYPDWENINGTLQYNKRGEGRIFNEVELEAIKNAPIYSGFKYITTPTIKG